MMGRRSAPACPRPGGAPSERLSLARAERVAATQAGDALRQAYGIQSESFSPLVPETLDKLRSLGYIR